MENLIKYINSKLDAVKFTLTHEENPRIRAQYVRTHFDAAFGAVEYFYDTTWHDNPILAKKVDDLWMEVYKPKFEELIYWA